MSSWDTAVVGFRRDLHRIPELGYEEWKTSAYLHAALTRMGLTPHAVGDTPGIICDIPGGSAGPTVLVRADMDGLPVPEATGLPFASEHVDRMHACGHDGHMAIALGLAMRLAATRDFSGQVRMLFQPSEERPPGGAPGMIAAGVLDGVDRVLGLHLWAMDPVGTLMIRSGPLMATADQFVIAIQGRGGHGSEPQNTQDAVLIAAQTVMALQSIVSRRLAPTDIAVVTCGALHAGHTFNAIADTAEILGTVRSLDETVRRRVRQWLGEVAEGTAALYGARATMSYDDGYPVLVNPERETDWVIEAVQDVVTVRTPLPYLAAEDFSYYLEERPGAYFFLGAAPEEGPVYSHHASHFRISEAALPLGVEVLHRVLRRFLAEDGLRPIPSPR